MWWLGITKKAGEMDDTGSTAASNRRSRATSARARMRTRSIGAVRRTSGEPRRGNRALLSLGQQLMVALVPAVVVGALAFYATERSVTTEVESQASQLSDEIAAAREEGQRVDRVGRYGAYMASVEELRSALLSVHAFLEETDGADGPSLLLLQPRYEEVAATRDEAMAAYRVAGAEADLLAASEARSCLTELEFAFTTWNGDLVESEADLALAVASTQVDMVAGRSTETNVFVYTGPGLHDPHSDITIKAFNAAEALRYEVGSSDRGIECLPETEA
jgi:hypothetical protein